MRTRREEVHEWTHWNASDKLFEILLFNTYIVFVLQLDYYTVKSNYLKHILVHFQTIPSMIINLVQNLPNGNLNLFSKIEVELMKIKAFSKLMTNETQIVWIALLMHWNINLPKICLELNLNKLFSNWLMSEWEFCCIWNYNLIFFKLKKKNMNICA